MTLTKARALLNANAALAVKDYRWCIENGFPIESPVELAKRLAFIYGITF